MGGSSRSCNQLCRPMRSRMPETRWLSNSETPPSKSSIRKTKCLMNRVLMSWRKCRKRLTACETRLTRIPNWSNCSQTMSPWFVNEICWKWRLTTLWRACPTSTRVPWSSRTNWECTSRSTSRRIWSGKRLWCPRKWNELKRSSLPSLKPRCKSCRLS